MTTIAKCPTCNTLLSHAEEECGVCGSRTVTEPPAKAASKPPPDVRGHHELNAVNRAWAKQQAKDLAEIAHYKQAHPGASMREACMHILRKRGLWADLPAHIRVPAEVEMARAISERKRKEAIEAAAKTQVNRLASEAAQAPDFESALEAHDERAAIQADGD